MRKPNIILVLFLVLMSGLSTFCEELQVKFLAQGQAGGWNHNMNCGQTTLVMAVHYFLGGSPTAQEVLEINQTLGKNATGGSGSSFSELVQIASSKYGISAQASKTSDIIQVIKSEIDQDRPVILAVKARYLSSRKYSYAGSHFILAVGYDDNHIIANEPGSSSGDHFAYTNKEIVAACNAEGSQVILFDAQVSGFAINVVRSSTIALASDKARCRSVVGIDPLGYWETFLTEDDFCGTRYKNLVAFGSIRENPNSSQCQIFLFNLDSGMIRKLSDGKRSDKSPWFSTDGKMIVYSSAKECSIDAKLFLMDIGGKMRTQITSENGYEPCWRGNNVVYRHQRQNGDGEIYLLDINSKKTRCLARDLSKDLYNPQLTLDGQTVIFASDTDIYSMDIDGKNRKTIQKGQWNSIGLAVLGDKVLYYFAGHDGYYTCDLDGGNLQKIK